MKLKLLIPVLIFLLTQFCSLFTPSPQVKSSEFRFDEITKSNFTHQNERPFPLTVRMGNNAYNTTTADGRYLFFASDSAGNFDIYLRDLKNAVTLPVTNHPAPQYKPAISPNGKRLAFVTERFDSEGDIAVVDINPEKWVKAYLKGKDLANSFDLEVPTNPDFNDPSKIIRTQDTDPEWSHDGRYIAFSSKRFSPSVPNIVLMDTENKYTMRQITTKGGASPYFSPDGKTIYYLSFQDSKKGEIYSVAIDSGEVKRLTNDEFMDFCPSVSQDNRYLYYTSVRRDSNGNGKLDERDNSYIIRLDMVTGKFIELTAGNLSLFDTKYSNLMNGSILFTASLDNALNIYYIPALGEIPKQDNIVKQYNFARLYRDRSIDFFKLALNSFYFFFENDPLYTITYSRGERQLVLELQEIGDDSEAEKVLKRMFQTKGDPNYGLSYALAHELQETSKNRDPVPELKKYYEEMKAKPEVHPEIPPSLLQIIGESYADTNKQAEANAVFDKIIAEYPNYYRMQEVKRREGTSEYALDETKIPKRYSDILNDPISVREDIKFVMESVQKTFSKKKSPAAKKELADTYLKDESLMNSSLELKSIVLYSKALAYSEEDNFEESTKIIDSYLPGLKKGSYAYLKSKLLRGNNQRDLGNENEAIKEIKDFIEYYDYNSAVEINETDLENSFLYFETKAREYERKKQYKEAIKNYINNNVLLSLAIEKKIPVKKIYRNYSVFYQKKMIEASVDLSNYSEEGSEKEILSKFNLLGKRQLDVLGNTTESLSYVFRPKLFRIFGDFRDLQFLSPVNEDAFEQSEEYFKERIDKARSSLEFGTVYGNAYSMVTRAIINESFFINEQAMTRARKARVLGLLKQAEYDLKWIIYSNPNYPDAYILLGWLYQYIDVRKHTTVFPENKKDEEVFESLYEEYFPGKYLEESIELYQQILQFLGPKYNNKKVLADIHLNLANSYFLLSNYEKALGEYETSEKISRNILDNRRFESYKQKALFYFNFARANIYNGKLSESIPHLKTSLDIYYKQEYFPLLSKLGVNNNNPELKKYLEDVKKKIALLNAVLGLSQMELEMYEDAITSFTTALSMNGKSDFINDISLYNSIAICYQEIGDYRKSDSSLKLAERVYEKRKINLAEYLDKLSVIDQFWTYVWDKVLDDKSRVIGDGRFPGEFPDEFANLLTQSVKISNSQEKQDFSEVAYLIENRSQFIKDKNLDNTVIGDRILSNKFGEEGYNEFLRGNYFESARLYTEHYRELTSRKEETRAFKAYMNSDISLYYHIEQNSEKHEVLIKELTGNITFLNKFKANNLNSCIKSVKPETLPENSTPDDFCLKDFYTTFYQYDSFLANNYFYLGEIYNSKKEYEKAYSNYGMALPLYKNPSGIKDEEIGLENDRFSPRERARLKLLTAITHLRIGNENDFEKTLKESYYTANEYMLERELLSYYIIESENQFRTGKFARSIEFADRAENLLKASPGLWYDIDEVLINYIFSLKTPNLIKLKRYEELSVQREKLYSAIFFRQLMINELRFQDQSLFRSLNRLQLLIWEDKELRERIAQVNLSGNNPATFVNLKAKNYESIQKSLKDFNSLLPRGMDISSWNEKKKQPGPRLSKNELLVQIFSTGKEMTESVTYSGKTTYKNYLLNTKNDTDTIAKELELTLEKYPDVKQLIILPSPWLYNVNFPGLVHKDKKLNDYYDIRHIFRLSQLERESEKEFSRLKRMTSVNPFADEEMKKKSKFSPVSLILKPIDLVVPKSEVKAGTKNINLRVIPAGELKNYLTDTDVLEGPTDFSNRKHYIGEKIPGHINIKEIVENQWDIPFIILTNYSNSMDNFIKTCFLYDILQFTGVQSIVLIEGKAGNEKIRDSLISNVKSANSIIKNEKVLLIGEKINAYPESQKIFKEEFEKYTKLALIEERKRNYLSGMKYLLQANSVLPDDDSEYSIKSELNLAKMKTKTFPNRKYLTYFESLLEKFPAGSKEEELILYDLLLTCYNAPIEIDCEAYAGRYESNSIAKEDKKFIVNYYKNLRQGNMKFIDTEYEKFLSSDTGEDPYMQNMRLAYLFSRGFIWEKAVKHAREALRISASPEEKRYALSRLSDIEYELFFIQGKDPDLTEETRVFYYASNRLWETYRKKAKEAYSRETDSFRRTYQARLFDAYESLENNPEFDPSSLGPFFMKDGRPALYILRETDRNFLFHLLLKSISYQTGEELNNQFDILIDTELKLNNYNRALWMLIQWASSLLKRGDYENARKYYNDFDKNFSDYYPEKNLSKAYHILKYKLSKIYDEIEFTKEERDFVKKEYTDWFNYYEICESPNADEYIPKLRQLIKSKSSEKLDLFNSGELHDFLSFLQLNALQNKRPDVFLDLGFYREKINATNDKILGKTPRFSDLPEVRSLTVKIKDKLPKGQIFTAFVDLGIKTYAIKIKDKTVTEEKAFDDNRQIKFSILEYLQSIKSGGTSPIKQESLETIYRDALKLERKAVDYIYLPSYHFKSPIEPTELDNFYYVLSPDLMVDRAVYDSSHDFGQDFSVEMHHSSYSEKSWKLLKDLESYELKAVSGSGKGGKIIIASEDLQFKDLKKLEYAGRNLTEVSQLGTRHGVWIHTGSLLNQSSQHNDNYTHSLLYLDKIHQGPGVVCTGYQNNTNNAYFLKRFLKPKNGQYPFQERYYEAFIDLQQEFRDDRFWNGYRPYTNVFIR